MGCNFIRKIIKRVENEKFYILAINRLRWELLLLSTIIQKLFFNKVMDIINVKENGQSFQNRCFEFEVLEELLKVQLVQGNVG